MDENAQGRKFSARQVVPAVIMGFVALALAYEDIFFLWESDGPMLVALALSIVALGCVIAAWVKGLKANGIVWLLAGFVLFALCSSIWAYWGPDAFPIAMRLGAAASVFLICWVLVRWRAANLRIVLAGMLSYITAIALLSLETASSWLLLRPLITSMASTSVSGAVNYGSWTGARMLTLTSPDVAATLALVGGLIAVWFALTTKQVWVRWLNVAALVVLAFEFVLCFSIDTAICAIPVLVGGILLAQQRRRWLLLTGLGAVIAVALAVPVFLFGVPASNSPETITGLLTSFSFPVSAWADALAFSARSFAFGSGLGSFTLGQYQVQDAYRTSQVPFNFLLQALDEVGIFGVILLVLALVFAFRAIWRMRKSNRPLADLLLPALSMLLLHSLLGADTNMLGSLSMIAVILALAAASPRESLTGPAKKAKGAQAAEPSQNLRTPLILLAVLPLATIALIAGRMSGTNTLTQASQLETLTAAKVESAVSSAMGVDPLHRAEYLMDYTTAITQLGVQASTTTDTGSTESPTPSPTATTSSTDKVNWAYLNELSAYSTRSTDAANTLISWDIGQDNIEWLTGDLYNLTLCQPKNTTLRDQVRSCAETLLEQYSTDETKSGQIQTLIDALG
ncbi:MAG: O-antigen ligase family protein [Propionibacteriaceae bacterium]|jgi:O-antigen ligase|nr:O-antigen ligase family protein [Propionibacteriaceae bacterium]